MKQETLSIAFFIRKTNLLKNGEAPITIRVTFKGVSEEARIHRTIDPRLWNQAKSCSKGKDKSSLEINDYIESLRVKVRSLYKELLLAEEHITPKYLLAGLFNQKNKQTVLKTMKTEIERMEELIGIDYEKVTINRYWNCYKSVATCISQFYKKEDIVFPELSKDFIKHLDRYLRIEKRLSTNTVVRYMKSFKKFTNMAIDEGWIKHNPFSGIKYRQQETDPTFLTMDEISRIANADISMNRLLIIRDTFLFCCFTGLAFIDAQELKHSDIYTDNNGKLWIRKGRHKLKKSNARCICNIPLLKPAIEILDKYKDHSKCIEKNVCLPVYCNQTMNVYLKQIATICNIDKHLTTHVARHTFATTITLANKVSLQNVSKMLGHTSTRMTEHYARVLDQSIMEDMNKLSINI
jgi:hypothetical protein